MEFGVGSWAVVEADVDLGVGVGVGVDAGTQVLDLDLDCKGSRWGTLFFFLALALTIFSHVDIIIIY